LYCYTLTMLFKPPRLHSLKVRKKKRERERKKERKKDTSPLG